MVHFSHIKLRIVVIDWIVSKGFILYESPACYSGVSAALEAAIVFDVDVLLPTKTHCFGGIL